MYALYPEAPAEIRSRARLARRYAAYYGSDGYERLGHFDVVILQPEAFSPEQILGLSNSGTIPLAYLSISEDSERRDPPAPWVQRDSSGAALLNHEWGSSLVEVGHPLWREHVLDQARAARAHGFAGLMLDTLDAPDIEAVTRLVIALRLHWPDAVLIMNRGFGLLETLVWHVDGVIFESFSTTWELDAAGVVSYRAIEGPELEENRRVARAVSGYIAPFGLARWALDYAASEAQDAATLRRQAFERASELGYVSFVTDRALREL